MTQTADAPPPLRWSERLFRASTLRLIFVRLLALGFLALGLYQWSALLGFQWQMLLGTAHGKAPDFFTLTIQAQAVILFFAVANLVAAVGLWLMATWGVVVWFSAAGARIVRHTLFASTFGWAPAETGLECVGVILFILLIVFEARAERREIIRQRESRRSRARD